MAVKRATLKIRPQNAETSKNHGILLSARSYARHLVCPMAPVADSVVGSCADNGEVNEVVPLADKSCTLTIIQRVVEYLKKHAEFEAQGAEDEVQWPYHTAPHNSLRHPSALDGHHKVLSW